MNPKVFREYDIRGVADRDLSDTFARDLGRAVGTHLGRAGAQRMAVGRDCRLTSPRLHAALCDGILSTGMHILDVGVVPTPLLYFAPFHFELEGAIQITGSHNPPEDNGFKIVRGKTTIYGAEIQELRRLIEARDFATGKGTREEQDVIRPYIEHAKRCLELGTRRPKVVVDAGNGVGGIVGVPLYREIGFEVVPLHCEPDGRFPNHHPDPTVEDNVADLKQSLVSSRAEIGIAYDGDADRLGVVDEKGRIVWGDQLMILFARAILAEKPGATFVSEVKCSQALYDEIARAGGNAIMWKVGHSLIKTKMKEVGAMLAGEMSGHIFFSHRYLGYDDAIYAGARLLELCSREQRTFSELVDSLPKMVNTPEIRVDMPDDIKFEVVRRATERFRARFPVVDVDGVRLKIDQSWGLLRASNTQPALVLRFEAPSQERLAEIRKLVEDELDAIRRELGA
ncbi:MAG: phosphomannomutase/phosphoglucomutase [Deltaproteobacteria bacterium]|nr:phosphomannomutase/phosphoglucomutase [Deltaproteobacteria bacterium]